MTKTYLTEFRGAIKGNARLRRKIDEANRKMSRIVANVTALILLADAKGFGDHPATILAAEAIGWSRMSQQERLQVIEQIKELHGGRQ
jgi:hypothetical protein